MTFTRKVSLITGVAFIITFVASIPAAFYFYAPVLDNADYILGAGADTRVGWGAVLEVILVVANIATAVVLYPVVKRQNEGVALGYVAARTFESTMIAVGIIAMLAVVTLRQEVAGAADAASSVALGQSLVAVHDWTFLLGPGILPGIGNGLLLGYLMYRSELVPKGMAVLGMVAGTLLIASAIPDPAWCVRGRVRAAGHRDGPGVRLGGVPGHLPHVQGVQGGRPAEARVRDRRAGRRHRFPDGTAASGIDSSTASAGEAGGAQRHRRPRPRPCVASDAR